MKYKRALEIPSEEFAFRRLYLNQVVGDKTKWLDIRKWKASNRKIETKSLLKRDCYAGLDLSSTTDITALVLVFPLPDGEYTAMYFYFIPEENMRDRVKRDRVQYDVWEKQGYLITTPGNVLDYDAIYLKILELNRLFRICEIAYDRWEAVYLSTKLENEGFTMVGFGQGFASMSAPSKDLIKLTLSKKLHNGDHPVTNWMASNLVMRMDPAGNIKPDKAHSEEKIDGMVATIMGLDRAMRHGIERSVYEDRGVREV
jgi:phage terminase large subunit-like protein